MVSGRMHRTIKTIGYRLTHKRLCHPSSGLTLAQHIKSPIVHPQGFNIQSWVHDACGGSDFHHECRWVEWYLLAEVSGDMEASVEICASVR